MKLAEAIERATRAMELLAQSSRPGPRAERNQDRVVAGQLLVPIPRRLLARLPDHLAEGLTRLA